MVPPAGHCHNRIIESPGIRGHVIRGPFLRETVERQTVRADTVRVGITHEETLVGIAGHQVALRTDCLPVKTEQFALRLQARHLRIEKAHPHQRQVIEIDFEIAVTLAVHIAQRSGNKSRHIGIGRIEPLPVGHSGPGFGIPGNREQPSATVPAGIGRYRRKPDAGNHPRLTDTPRQRIHTQRKFPGLIPIVILFLPAIVDLEHLHRQLVPVFSQIIGHCENIFLRNVTHAPIPAAPAVNRFFRQVYTRNLSQPAVFALLGGSPRAERQQNLVRRTYLARLDQHFAHIAEDFEFHRSPFGADMEIDIRHQADGRHRNAFT